LKFLTNLRLWTKISLLTALGLVLGVGVFGALGMRAVNEATEAMLQDRLTTASLISDYVDESLSHAISELDHTTQLIEANQQPDYKFESSISALEQAYDRLSIQVYGIYVIDGAGHILYSKSKGPEAVDLSLASFPEIGQSIATGIPTVSGMLSAPGTNVPVIFLTGSFNTGSTGGRGALAVAIDLAKSNIGVFVRPLRLGQTGYVEIVDQAGTVISRTEPGPKLQPFEKSDHSGRFASLIDSGKPARGVCHTCHEPLQQIERRDVLAFVPLSNAHWGVVVRQSEDEANAAAHKLNQNIIFFGIGLALIGLLLVGVTTRDVGSRIKTLTNASRRIASGDLISPVFVPGKDEVGVLAQTIDEMRGKLKTSYSSLEQKTQELGALLSVSEVLCSNLGLPSLLDAIVTKAVEIVSTADSGVLLLEDNHGSGLKLQCAIGLDKETVAKTILSSNRTPDESNVQQPPLPSENNIHKAVELLLRSGSLGVQIPSYASADIQPNKVCRGTLILLNHHSGEVFSDANKRIIQAIADDISFIIEKDRLAKEAEETRALYEADKLRSQFIATVSHELRTPLTIIKGYATSLLRQNVTWEKETQREFLRSIDAKTDELRDLIDKILQSARMEAGAYRIEKEPISLPRIVRKTLSENVRWTQNHNFVLNSPPNFPIVEADSRCIEQVVRNLAENAVKYSPDGGDVLISLEAKGNEVLFRISDHGIGIPLQHQDKIFERFFRVKSPLAQSVGGSGLGLSICKGHIKAHGGRIWFDSNPGGGTSFYFSLPFNPEECLEKDPAGDCAVG
jgi:signal transduction histidine kinase/HAMP domain-containing protein